MTLGDAPIDALTQTWQRISSAPDAPLRILGLDDEAFERETASDGWIRGSDLASGQPAAYDRLRQAAMAVTGDVDAKTIGLAMAWVTGPLVSGPLAAYITDRRVPLVTHADLAIRLPGADVEALAVRPVRFACLPGDEMARLDPRAAPVVDEDALRVACVDILEDLIAPIAEHLHARSTVARGAVWGLAAGTVIYELAEALAGETTIELAILEAEHVLAAAPRLGRRRPALFVFDAAGGPWFGMKGAVCCRAYKWTGRDEELCLSCPLRDDASRLDGLRAWRSSLVATVPAGGSS